MASESNAARKRINRFVDEHGDELLSLSKQQQNELLDLVYTNQGVLARSKLRRYMAVVSEKRHSVKAAITKRTRDEQARLITDAINTSISDNRNMRRAKQAKYKDVRRNVARNEDEEATQLVEEFADDPTRLGNELRLRASEVSGEGIFSMAFYHGLASS